MDTVYILLASLAAILALAAVNAVLGGWTRPRIASVDAAARELAADNVAFDAADGAVTEDGRAALVAERGGPRVGLVVVQGDSYVTRLFRPGDVREARVTPAGDLVILTRDFTMPRAVVALKNSEIAQNWALRLTPPAPSESRDGAPNGANAHA